MLTRALVPIVLALSVSGAAAQEPLHLGDAVAEALRNSPELGSPEDAVTSADLHRRQAAAPFGVRVTPNLASSSMTGYDTRTVGFTAGKMLTTGADVWVTGSSNAMKGFGGQYLDRGYSVGVSQPLNDLMSHAATAPLTAAKAALSSAERKLTAARQQLVVSVAEAYYGVLEAERLYDAAQLARERARGLVDGSEARAKAGLDTQLDVMRAQLLASQADAALGDREESLDRSRERLNLLLGRSADADISVADDPLAAGSAVTPDTSDAVNAALAHRVELRDSQARIEDARHALSIARWDLMPPLTLNVEYVQRGFGSPFRSLFEPYNGWHFSVSSNYRIDRATQAAAVAGTELTVRAAERDAQAVEQRIAVEARQAARAVAKADQTAQIEAQAHVIAERQVELAKLRYERGLADNLTVVDAEAALAQADVATISAEIERHLARLRLQRAEGTLDPSNLGSSQ